jgi:SSS family solute:Na+ symporter
MNLHYIDISIIVIYFLGLFYLGYRKPKGSSTDSYVLMGRRLTLMPFVMTLVSTWYGGILGVSEFSYTYGVSNWIIFGLPYYVFGLLFAFKVAKRAHRLKVSSLPEIMGKDYGKYAGIVAAVLVMILASPAPYVLTLGFLLNYFFGIPLLPALILGTVSSLIYILRGGFSAVVKTDALQFVLMFSGFIFLLTALISTTISPIQLFKDLPTGHTSLTGGHNLGYIVVWFFIGSWTLVDPGFHQRVYAAKTEGIAKRGIIIAVLFWFLFDLMTTLTGLYAFSLLPEGTNAAQAFLVLGAKILPPGLLGIFYTAILSTVMSTLDSNSLISGISLGKDILGEFKYFQKWSTTLRIKLSMVVLLGLGIVLAWRMQSVVDLWYTLSTITIPGLLLPTLQSILDSPRNANLSLTSLILSPLVSLGWFFFAKIDDWNYLWGIEPFYPGILTSVIILIIFPFIQKESQHV